MNKIPINNEYCKNKSKQANEFMNAHIRKSISALQACDFGIASNELRLAEKGHGEMCHGSNLACDYEGKDEPKEG